MYRITFCLLFLYGFSGAQSMKHGTPAEKKKNANGNISWLLLNDVRQPDHYLRFTYENDLFTLSDYYYTQGIFFEIALPALMNNPVNKALPCMRYAEAKGYSLSIHTEGFTPTSIKSDSILYGDRPYAGTILLGIARNCVRYNAHLKSELRIGVIGPAGLGYESQKFIHEHTNNPVPHGWEYQVANDFIIGYDLKWDHNLFHTRFFRMRMLGELNAGTEYDNCSFGLLGKIPLAGEGRHKKFRFSIDGTINREFVFYNATLQGGAFNRSSVYTIAHKDISKAVNIATLGFSIGFGRLNIECYDTWITREFIGGRAHAWGHLGFIYNFK